MLQLLTNFQEVANVDDIINFRYFCNPFFIKCDYKEVCMSSKNRVTKHDLVEAVYENTRCEKKVIQTVIESFLEQLKTSLENKSDIELRGFGTFELRLRKGKKEARNPKTGEKVIVPPHYIAAFRAGQSLRNSLRDLPVTDDSSNS